MKKLTLVVLVTLMASSSSFVLMGSGSVNAATINKSQEISIVKNYISFSSTKLAQKLNALKKKDSNVTISDINKSIRGFYKKNPAPAVMINDPSLKFKDVFPKKAAKFATQNAGKAFNINKFVNNQKVEQTEGKVVEFNNQTGKIDVFISNTGGMIITQTKVETVKPSLNTNLTISPEYIPYEYTSKETTTAYLYNGLGEKVLKVWAEGQFEYNGSSVSPVYADGSYTRYMWGSDVSVQPITLGGTRTLYEGNYKYSEVYSKVHASASFGFRGVGITFYSGTLYTVVDCTVNGNMSGSAYEIQ